MRLVDADALMESLKESADRANKWYEDCKTYNSAMIGRAEQTIMTFNEGGLRIKNAPTVDAVPVRHGRWTDKDGGIATCSVCGDRWGVWSVMKYCPNCGAKMDGKDGDHHD